MSSILAEGEGKIQSTNQQSAKKAPKRSTDTFLAPSKKTQGKKKQQKNIKTNKQLHYQDSHRVNWKVSGRLVRW